MKKTTKNNKNLQNIDGNVSSKITKHSSTIKNNEDISDTKNSFDNSIKKSYNFIIEGLKKIQKAFSKEIKKWKKNLKKQTKIYKKTINKKIRKEINYYLERKLKKLMKKKCSYRYLLNHLYPEKQLDYLGMQILGLLDIHNKLKYSMIETKKIKNKKIIKKILKLYNEEVIMYEFIKYLRKKYNIK